MNSKITLVLMLFLNLETNAQEMHNNLHDVLENVAKRENLDIHYETSVFKNSISEKPEMTINCFLKKEGDNILIEIKDENLILYNKNVSLIVHEARKQIEINHRKSNLSQKPFSALADFEEIIETADKVMLLEEEGGYKKYSISLTSGEIEKIIVELELNLQTIKSIEYLYRTNDLSMITKVIVSFKSWNSNPTFDSQQFDLSRFVTQSEGDYEPSPEYSQYDISIRN